MVLNSNKIFKNFKKSVFCLSFLFFTNIFFTNVLAVNFFLKDITNLALDKNYQPTKNLLELLTFLDIKHDSYLKNIVEITQKKWLRKSGKERWDIQDKFNNKENNKKILPFLDKLGFCCLVEPEKKEYDYVLVLGGFFSRVEARISYLISLSKKVKFKKIFFLTGQRDLDSEKENEKILLSDYKFLKIKENLNFNNNIILNTETDMIKFIWNRIKLPEELENIEVIFIDAPKNENLRPTTEDTIDLFVKSVFELEKNNNYDFKKCLVISNQPFVLYQNSVFQTYLSSNYIKNKFIIETVGDAIDYSNINISELLDTVARFLYQENKRFLLN